MNVYCDVLLYVRTVFLTQRDEAILGFSEYGNC